MMITQTITTPDGVAIGAIEQRQDGDLHVVVHAEFTVEDVAQLRAILADFGDCIIEPDIIEPGER